MTQANGLADKYSHSYFVFFVVFLAVLGAFPSFINDLYLPTLPQMRVEFHTTPSVVQLGLSTVMIGLGFGELFWGPLSDRLGRKPALYMSIAVFIVFSAISIFSPTITFFIICRFFQGLGGAGPIMLARAIPADECQGRELAKIMAMIGAINGIAPVSGPLVGGFLADSIGWRGIFCVLACIGVLMILLSLKLKETLPKNKRDTGPIAALLHEYSILLHNRVFIIHTMLKSAALGVLFSYISAGPFIIQEHYGFSASEFGLVFGCNAIAVVIGAIVAVKFSAMKTAAIVGSAGMVAFALAEATAIYFIDDFLLFEALIIPMLFFSGIIFSSANTLAMSEGSQNAGAASALLGLGGYIFGCIVSPLVGLGNILRSTSLAISICSLIALYYGWRSWKLAKMRYQP